MPISFETIYLSLRRKEHRDYTDAVVRNLPFLQDSVLLKRAEIKREWKIREWSMKRLIRHLKKSPKQSVLELGCGNGWLSHHLAISFPSTEIVAIDIKEEELVQAQRVFGGQSNLRFIQTDIFKHDFSDKKFDAIILAGVTPYFPDLKALVEKLLSLLTSVGELHLLDSPVYKTVECDAARTRSEVYFEKMGYPEMKLFYHCHSWKELEGLHYNLKYNPNWLFNKFGLKLMNYSPFPWIIIKR